MATKTVEQSALTNMSQSTRIVSTGDQANELLGKAIALCHLCLVQVGGEVSDSERVEFRWVVATAEHMMLHVDANAGKSSPASPEIQAVLADIAAHHDALPRPTNAGRSIGQPRT